MRKNDFMENNDAGYLIPSEACRTEIIVVNSRFITTIRKVTSTQIFKQSLAEVRAEMPDASHHVYAFRVGYGNSVIEGVSDAGEPSGTAGPPTLAVLRGTEIGDVAIITTRYFGGTKLGTGGLVRAYTESAQTALAQLKTRPKIPMITLGIEIAYPLYEGVKRLILAHTGEIVDESFAGDVMIMAVFPEVRLEQFTHALAGISAGKAFPVVLDRFS
jgi:uncharacterized YigZ family protein